MNRRTEGEQMAEYPLPGDDDEVNRSRVARNRGLLVAAVLAAAALIAGVLFFDLPPITLFILVMLGSHLVMMAGGGHKH